MSSHKENKLSNKIDFDEKTQAFILFSADDKDFISIEYEPHLDTDFKDKEFDIYLLSNPYLNAESDHFNVKIKCRDKAPSVNIGKIFSIKALESNDISDVYLNKYKYRVFHELLRKADFPNNTDGSSTRITELYSESIIILAISREALPTGQEFQVHDYLASLACHGYYLWSTEYNRTDTFKGIQPFLQAKYKGKKNLNLVKNEVHIPQETFLMNFYEGLLQSIDHSFIKFHYLYQVVELFLEINNKILFQEYISKYSSDDLLGNDWKEHLRELNNERSSINILFKSVEEYKDTDSRTEFALILKDFSDKAGSEPKSNSLGDLIYFLRNYVVHNYRSICDTPDLEDLLCDLTDFLEIIVHTLIITYNNSSGKTS